MFNYDEHEEELTEFSKEEENCPIWKIYTKANSKGEPWLFSFDKKTVYDFNADYPDNLTAEQLELFNKHCPYMAELRGFGKPGWDKSGK